MLLQSGQRCGNELLLLLFNLRADVRRTLSTCQVLRLPLAMVTLGEEVGVWEKSEDGIKKRKGRGFRDDEKEDETLKIL